jgi:hypothetical protein
VDGASEVGVIVGRLVVGARVTGATEATGTGVGRKEGCAVGPPGTIPTVPEAVTPLLAPLTATIPLHVLPP